MTIDHLTTNHLWILAIAVVLDKNWVTAMLIGYVAWGSGH